MNATRLAPEEKFIMFRQPRGIVIDDSPYTLLESIESWIKEKFNKVFVPDWEVYNSSSNKGEIDVWISNADFVLLDNKIGKNFAGFKNGLDIGLYIVETNPDIQIFFYTGAEGELRSYGQKFKDFEDRPNVKFFNKGQLHPGGELDGFCKDIIKIPIENQLEKLLDTDFDYDLQTEIFPLLGAKLITEEQHSYQIKEFDRRRKFQTLRCLEDPWGNEIEVPTKHLKDIGISKNDRDINLRILQFNGGQILSYFKTHTITEEEISPDIIKILEE